MNTLVQQGMCDICIAPGSRSAPLALAAARYAEQNPELNLHCHFDERGLGFLALGIAKASLRPVSIITTSGTAVANLYPAVIEAFESSIPLVLLTADRPHELLDCGANQAINQHRIFGENVVSYCQLPIPNIEIPAHELVQMIHKTIWTGLELKGGPSHINCPFREPLYGTTSDHEKRAGFSSYLSKATHEGLDKPSRYFSAEPIHHEVSGLGIIIAGLLTTAQADKVLAFAHQSGWPVFADITSQLRLRNDPLIVTYHDLLLSQTEVLKQLEQVDHVIQFGGRLTSKNLNQWLAQYQGSYLLYSDRDKNLDPSHQARQIQIDFNVSLVDGGEKRPPSGLSKYFSQLGGAINKAMHSPLLQQYNELSVVHQLSRLLPPEMALFTGNSLPIRILELLAHARSGNPVYCNRGASGIDGLLATALGCRQQHPAGLTLLIGDTSLLHDLNSLALTRELQTPFVIVVLNNDGGGIFDLVAQQVDESIKNRLFRCPHGLQFDDASAMFDIAYYQPATLAEFQRHYQQACQQARCSLIEIKVKPGQTVKLIKSFRDTTFRSTQALNTNESNQ